MKMYEYLSQFREELPQWLREYREGDTIDFKDVMSSRVAYYPGFGRDGTMLKVGNMSHSVHSYIHLDYLNTYEKDMLQTEKLPGYRSIGHFDWEIEDVLPHGVNVSKSDFRFRLASFMSSDLHYFTEIMERLPDKDDSYGAERIALTVLCADGIRFYEQLFVKEYKKAPWLFLLQDHGYGGNYERFGKGRFLDKIMTDSGMWPEFVITDNDYGTTIWDGYTQIENIIPVVGGMHHNVRKLFRIDLKP